jgi:ribosomal protein S18 acetylase RimI-like enzyme
MAALVEELAANAWPAAIVQHVRGWRLRYNWGATRRANSVFASASADECALHEVRGLAEQFYAARGAPCRFQVAEGAAPAPLDAYLANCGYEREAPTTVLTADLPASMPDSRYARRFTVEIQSESSAEWVELYAEANALDASAAGMRSDIMRRVAVPAAYALTRHNDEGVALGWVAIERGWAGVFGMTTRPGHRRRGAGRATFRALAEHAAQAGAQRVYLHVEKGNGPARLLYKSAGLLPAYEYHYRTLGDTR